MTDEHRHHDEPERQDTGNATTREDSTILEKVLDDSPVPGVAREAREQRELEERERRDATS